MAQPTVDDAIRYLAIIYFPEVADAMLCTILRDRHPEKELQLVPVLERFFNYPGFYRQQPQSDRPYPATVLADTAENLSIGINDFITDMLKSSDPVVAYRRENSSWQAAILHENARLLHAIQGYGHGKEDRLQIAFSTNSIMIPECWFRDDEALHCIQRGTIQLLDEILAIIRYGGYGNQLPSSNTSWKSSADYIYLACKDSTTRLTRW
jgi:hypothetical protein